MINKINTFLLATAGLMASATGYCAPSTTTAPADTRLPAVKLINTTGQHSAFVKGTIPSLEKISTKDFWFSNTFEEWQKGVHPASRVQYVVTMKGKLKFKVSDGTTFIVEPGTVLIAADTEGEGHSWEILDGKEWVRMYIPIVDGNDHFTAD